MTDTLLKYRIAYSYLPKVGALTAKKIIAFLGSEEAVFTERRQALMKIPGIGETIADSIMKSDALEKAEEDVAFISKHDIKVYCYLDDDYPERLKNCPDSPLVLFAKGNTNLDTSKVLSVVGTRSATAVGIDVCNKIIDDLATRYPELLIVSGLAYGVDITAHKAALRNKLQTVAVLGHGLNQLYPSAHKNVAQQIVLQGALLSDFPVNTKLDRNNFIKRNRIIAGLADATLVVESGAKGGALVTADIADSYDRDVFAVPGRYNDPFSCGCNKLIKTNKAALVENASDIEYLMGWESGKSISKPIQQQLFSILSEEENCVVEVLKRCGDISIDHLAIELQQPVSKLSPLLLTMEMTGVLRSLPGKLYHLN